MESEFIYQDSFDESEFVELRKSLLNLIAFVFDESEDNYLSILFNLETGNYVETFNKIQEFQIAVRVMKEGITTMLLITDEYDEVDDIDDNFDIDDTHDLIDLRDIIEDSDINLN